MTASPPPAHHAPTAPAPAAAQDRSQQRKQLLDLAAEHAKLLSVLIADWAGDAGAVATPRDDGAAVRLPPIENRRPAPVDTGRHAHSDLATPLPDLPIATPRVADATASPASLWSRRKPLPAQVKATPARPKTPPRPRKSPRPKYSPLEPKPARPASVQAPRDAVRRRLRADVAARLRASRASSSDLRVVELAGDDEPLTSPLVLRPGPPAAFVERSALVAPAPADEGPPTPAATVVTPPSSVDAESWDPPTPEIPPRTALVAPMPLATKHTALAAPAPIVRAKPTALVAPEPSKDPKPVRARRKRCATA